MSIAATDPLAHIRAKLADLEARAAKREARDAARATAIDPPASTRRAPARVLKADAGGEADAPNWSTLAEDAALADRPQREYQGPTVAPEFVDRDPDESPELPGDVAPVAAVPAAPESLPVEAVNNAPTDSGAATHGQVTLPAKLPNAAWTQADHARWARMEARMMVARLAGPAAWRSPFDGVPTEPQPVEPRPAARAPPDAVAA